jgi:uncharacterized lipoprotein YajG
MKLKYFKIVFIFLSAFLVIISGCSKNHRVLIDPYIPVHNSNIGNGLPVIVKVVDTRPNNIISKWQGGYKIRKFTVISQGDLKDIFTTRIRQGLTKLGFSPKIFNSKYNRSLKIEILKIKSYYQEDPPKINIRVKAGIKATCKNQETRSSKNFTSRKNRASISPASFPNENLLNNSLSEIIGKILTDSFLMTCLAKRHNPIIPKK